MRNLILSKHELSLINTAMDKFNHSLDISRNEIDELNNLNNLNRDNFNKVLRAIDLEIKKTRNSELIIVRNKIKAKIENADIQVATDYENENAECRLSKFIVNINYRLAFLYFCVTDGFDFTEMNSAHIKEYVSRKKMKTALKNAIKKMDKEKMDSFFKNGLLNEYIETQLIKAIYSKQNI